MLFKTIWLTFSVFLPLCNEWKITSYDLDGYVALGSERMFDSSSLWLFRGYLGQKVRALGPRALTFWLKSLFHDGIHEFCRRRLEASSCEERVWEIRVGCGLFLCRAISFVPCRVRAKCGAWYTLRGWRPRGV